jgi:hypothetical protein
MSLEEIIMTGWIKNHTAEEKLSLVHQIMPTLLETMSEEDLMTLTSQMMPEMMKRCQDCMGRKDMIQTAHKIMIQMMEHCLSSSPIEDRQEMLAFYRDMLHGREDWFLTVKESC